MYGFVETWENADRWKVLNGVTFLVDDNKLYPDGNNPLLQFRQNISQGIAIETTVFPDDDLQLSLVKPSASIDFTNQDEITYFGVLYEKQYGSLYQQFVLNCRTAWDSPLQRIEFTSASILTVYKLLITSDGSYVKVSIYDELGELLETHSVAGVLSGDMTFLVNPGRMVTDSIPPWIGETRFAWGATAAEVADFESDGGIIFPAISAPVVKSNPSFVEGTYSRWVGPLVGASGVLTVETASFLPGGLSVSMQGGNLVIFGAPLSGTAGTYPVTFVISDGLTTTTVSMELVIVITSQWAVDPGPTDDVVSFGDYYYQISGGPIRKEFTIPEGSP